MLVLARGIHLVFGLYALGLIVYSLLSWVQTPWSATTRGRLGRIYEPILTPIRNLLKSRISSMPGFDFSPLILLVVVYLLRGIVIGLLIPGF